jgi:pimeloyl-ACP methyl ester carboxylesterase
MSGSKLQAWLARNGVSALGGETSLAVIRAGFGIGERIAPRLAGVAGQRIWFRVPPAPPPSRRDRGVGVGEPLPLAVEGRKLNVRTWGEGPVVLLMHGWSGWWQQLGVYVEPLVAAGFQVVAWDAPSHGDSAPGRHGRHYASIADLVDALTVVSAHFDQVAAIVAHSAGAMAAGVAVASGAVRPHRVVLVSPSVSGADQIAYLTSRLGWGPRTAASVQVVADQRCGIRMADYDVPQLMSECPAELPLALFIQDRDDQEVPADSSARLAAHWPGAEVISTSGFDHFRVLWAPETVRRTVDFLSGRTSAARTLEQVGN